MSRKLRGLENITPQRYLNTPFDLEDFPRYGTRIEARAANPYKVGDVIWAENGRPALVVVVHVDRIHEGDVTSPLLPRLKIRPQTVKGEWAKNWVYIWPGGIERGYEKAQGVTT
jgi:hypothetical protein